MQDQYAGDIGDFVKYGLLRAISEGKCLGVAWYLCTDSGSTKKGDGRHIDYLKQDEKWRHLDCELFNTLKGLVDEGKRSVSEIRKSGILGMPSLLINLSMSPRFRFVAASAGGTSGLNRLRISSPVVTSFSPILTMASTPMIASGPRKR